jgi:hypothetical protein
MFHWLPVFSYYLCVTADFHALIAVIFTAARYNLPADDRNRNSGNPEAFDRQGRLPLNARSFMAGCWMPGREKG